ncbi:MAG: PQQ-dependent sugar dehydrogenase [Pseudomonadota bacterium]
MQKVWGDDGAPLTRCRPVIEGYLLEKSGVIRNFPNNVNTQTNSVYLDISGPVADGGEGGLLGLAFHPDFDSNRAVFLNYTSSTTGSLQTRISSFIANAQNTGLQVNTESIVLTVGQPFNNHNGGAIAFGKDGNLYIGYGDGGGSNDDLDSAQSPSTLLGSFARINVDALTSYTVPPNNPFVNTQGFAPETYAYGFRNPWRWSFDSLTGTLWVGDVGQGRFEEIDIVRAGENHGWRCYEGNSMFNTDGCPDASELTFPVHDYGRSAGRSVTGGYVYRGDNIANLQGSYVYGDFATGRIWALRPLPDGTYRNIPLLDTDKSIAAFAQGNDGEIYYLSFNDGEIYQLVPGF